MSNVHLQKGIIEWFRMDPKSEKKSNALQTVCSNLFKTIDEGNRNYRYEMIYPLLKLGVIEYYNGNYKLSPSCALLKKSNVLFCNIPQLTETQPPLQPLFDSELGIEVYENNSQPRLYLQQLGITSSPFNLTKLLQKVSLSRIIESWPLTKVFDTRGYFFLTENNDWKPIKKLSAGVYRAGKELYAKRLLMMSETNWYSISNNWNDFAVAVLWTKIQNDQRLQIQYKQKEESLYLNTEYFPLILERLLLLNTLLEGKFKTTYNYRQYYITRNEFTSINNIFQNRIPVV
jgi:hypothetical protein